MKIAINARFLTGDYREGYGNFIYAIFSRLAVNYPQHEFIFLHDRRTGIPPIEGKNVTTVIAGPAARHPLLWKWWYDITVPRLLRKYKAEVFVSCDGFCSLVTKVPQCLVVHDLAYLHHPAFIPKSHLLFYKRYMPRFIRKADQLITVSAFSRNDIAKQSGRDSNSISIVSNGVNEIFRALTTEERSLTKEKYCGGREYFLYVGAVHPRKNLINLLKAFSLFKKRQQSSMKLVITGRMAWKNEAFKSKLKTYRYRDDVVLTGYVADSDLATIMGSAYAMVYPSLFEGFGVPVIEAMKAGVPVITSKGTAMEETGGNAVMLADPRDPKEIADSMMLLYKDENRRAQMIAAGFDRVKEFSWDKSALQMWDCIQAAVR